MRDMISKAVSLGLGLAVAGKEQAEKLVDELVKRGEMSREESFAFVDDLLKKGEDAQRRVSDLVQERVQAFGDRTWATKEDIERLEQRIDMLIARLDAQHDLSAADPAGGKAEDADQP
ncbi:hypothetical protein COLU111180_00025 [Cohnella lubricantis]|uniref:Polyhydroxyalkanoate synthesis regulator n=1 Tax=Cohnella lubricantis TaxID=2163172 RepID=A0A841TCR0_9BACL|nr:hypothetical protein [Cohnella lubricantis]MBB6677789.1 hypothetical protein [Cohnella lubricantis]MBP2119001.1 polyhydroxyalkanoate synthesis regulator phasin [Cohnella lubricantis]